MSLHVHLDYLADPFCFRHGDWYYAVATGKAECYSPSFEGPHVVPMVKSRDLRHWERVGRVLELPPEPFTCFWAPEIAVHDGRFYMYYHPCRAGRGGYHIRVAVADQPEGPYRDTGRPLTDPDKNPFAIDSHPFQDDDGQWYLFYATDFLDFDDKTFRGTALVVDKLKSMTELEGRPQVVMRAHWPWQRYQAQQKSHGVVADWYTLEGPAVRKHNGRYTCFYSGGCYQNDSYGVDWLEADHIFGPWREIGCARGPQLMRSVPGKVIGPGHHSIVTSPEGVDYAVYHAWNKAMTDRLMCVDRLDWIAGVPSIARFAAVGAGRADAQENKETTMKKTTGNRWASALALIALLAGVFAASPLRYEDWVACYCGKSLAPDQSAMHSQEERVQAAVMYHLAPEVAFRLWTLGEAPDDVERRYRTPLNLAEQLWCRAAARLEFGA